MRLRPVTVFQGGVFLEVFSRFYVFISPECDAAQTRLYPSYRQGGGSESNGRTESRTKLKDTQPRRSKRFVVHKISGLLFLMQYSVLVCDVHAFPEL